MDRSPASNNLKALLARKRRFEGPKSGLEQLEGTAGSKKAIQGTEVQPRMSKHSLLEKPNSKQNRVVEKPASTFELKRISLPQESRHC
jgi:hypothetical protein